MGRGYNLIHLVEQLPSVLNVRGSSIAWNVTLVAEVVVGTGNVFSGLRAVIRFIGQASMSRFDYLNPRTMLELEDRVCSKIWLLVHSDFIIDSNIEDISSSSFYI